MIAYNPVTNITSNPATLTVNPAGNSPGTDVTTYHNDIARTGQNITETKLTQANVNSGRPSGPLRNLAVDSAFGCSGRGAPLIFRNFRSPWRGSAHNVVFVLTEHDSAYARSIPTPVQAQL